MSDGNFNRALLPHTPYASGLKAGKAMMKAKAIDVFRQWLEQHHPDFTDEERSRQLEDFRSALGV